MKRVIFGLAIPLLVIGWGSSQPLRPANSTGQADEPRVSLQTMSVMATMTGGARDSFEAVLDEFNNQTGILAIPQYVTEDAIANVLLNCTASDSCPDVAMVPQPLKTYGLIRDLALQGALVPLEPIVTSFDTYYNSTWRNLASIQGTLYGVPFEGIQKSLIWYRPQAFAAVDGAAPSTWGELLSISDELVLDGQTPFAIGAESGGASGWPLSDWFENLLIRAGGPDVHRMLARHQIPWTHQSVLLAMQRLSDIVGTDEYVVGGSSAIPITSFLDALEMVFGSTPSGTMYSAARWIRGFIPGTLVPGIDYDQFQFPEIDPSFGKPLMGNASFALLFSADSEAQSLIQFLATPDAAEVWAARGGFVSPNGGVDPNAYPDVVMRALAQHFVNAEDFVFDMDDQLPDEVQLCVWAMMMDYVANQDQLETILQEMEDCATTYQGSPYSIYLPIIVQAAGP